LPFSYSYLEVNKFMDFYTEKSFFIDFGTELKNAKALLLGIPFDSTTPAIPGARHS